MVTLYAPNPKEKPDDRTESHPHGGKGDWLEIFSDGVFAIAITLLT
ncbi:MAG: hypothetical protein ACR2M0_14195 [Chloroflexia bacterium]